MHTVYSAEHRLRDPRTELHGGELVAPFECPARAEMVLKHVKQCALGPVLSPRSHSLDQILRIHDQRYIHFLQTCWTDWQAAGYAGEAIPYIWPLQDAGEFRSEDIQARLGHFALASDTAISDGTWQSTLASARVALTAQSLVANGQESAFALCRPPGHHATTDRFGGYCFVNNAAIVAQAFLDQGALRVAILDVDFHHGNGTQSIFYDRRDVMVLSLHGDPRVAFPYFTGYADEIGSGDGEGFTANYPLPRNTEFEQWDDALTTALRRIFAYAPDALVISLGVDTFIDDPISFFRLQSEDFTRYGARLATANLPTVFLMEGGYATEELGLNTTNVLRGFEGG